MSKPDQKSAAGKIRISPEFKLLLHFKHFESASVQNMSARNSNHTSATSQRQQMDLGNINFMSSPLRRLIPDFPQQGQTKPPTINGKKGVPQLSWLAKCAWQTSLTAVHSNNCTHSQNKEVKKALCQNFVKDRIPERHLRKCESMERKLFQQCKRATERGPRASIRACPKNGRSKMVYLYHVNLEHIDLLTKKLWHMQNQTQGQRTKIGTNRSMHG